jgi:hypothetical protein
VRRERDPLDDALGQTLGSPGWQDVILPFLENRLAGRRSRLERASLSDVEKLQAEIWLLRQMVEEPHRFFKPGNGKREKT